MADPALPEMTREGWRKRPYTEKLADGTIIEHR